MSSENIWNDDEALSQALRERQQQNRKKYTRSDSNLKQDEDMKREIREKSKSPTEEIMKEFPNDVESELYEHKKKMRKNPNLSGMVQIPLPNKSRKQSEFPYESKYKTRGGVKKRKMTKRKRSMKKNKKSKKQKGKRRTNKKRGNKKRKTRKIKGGNNYQKCIDKCNKEFSDALHKAQDMGVSDDIVLGIHKKKQDCYNDCRTSDTEIHGGKRKTRTRK